jgi:hypothetical protein
MSHGLDFERHISTRAAARQKLITTMRDMTAKAASGELDAYELSDDAFLEPRLFAWHFGTSGDMVRIAQMLFGALPRPPSAKWRVRTDTNGAVVLAGVGTLLTDLPNTELQLSCNVVGQPVELLLHDRKVGFRQVPRLVVPGTAIEVVEHDDPVIQAFFGAHVDRSRPLKLVKTPASHMPQIVEALRLIKACAPVLHHALIESLRSIVLFQHPSASSFAALQVHGMIFLNLCRPASTAFFVDGLVHQGGHVVFSEATLERQAYFKVHPDTRMEEIIGAPDTRSVYEALHGLFTECALVNVMDRARMASDLALHQAIELHARTGFILRRLGADLRRLAHQVDQVFSPLGLDLVSNFNRVYDDISGRRRSVVPVDLEGQPDEFDIDMFLRRNRTFDL